MQEHAVIDAHTSIPSDGSVQRGRRRTSPLRTVPLSGKQRIKATECRQDVRLHVGCQRPGRRDLLVDLAVAVLDLRELLKQSADDCDLPLCGDEIDLLTTVVGDSAKRHDLRHVQRADERRLIAVLWVEGDEKVALRYLAEADAVRQ